MSATDTLEDISTEINSRASSSSTFTALSKEDEKLLYHWSPLDDVDVFLLDPLSIYLPNWLHFKVFENPIVLNYLIITNCFLFLFELFVLLFVSSFGFIFGSCFCLFTFVSLLANILCVFHVTSSKIFFKIVRQFEFWYLELNLLAYTSLNLWKSFTDVSWNSTAGTVMVVAIEMNFFVAITCIFFYDSFVTLSRKARIVLFSAMLINMIRVILGLFLKLDNRIFVVVFFGFRCDFMKIHISTIVTLTIYFFRYFCASIWSPSFLFLIRSSLVCLKKKNLVDFSNEAHRTSLQFTRNESYLNRSELLQIKLSPVSLGGDFVYDPIIRFLSKWMHVKSPRYVRIVCFVAVFLGVTLSISVFFVVEIGFEVAAAISTLLFFFWLTFGVHSIFESTSLRLLTELFHIFEYWYLLLNLTGSVILNGFISQCSTDPNWSTISGLLLTATSNFSYWCYVTVCFSIDALPYVITPRIRIVLFSCIVLNAIRQLVSVTFLEHYNVPIYSLLNWDFDVLSTYRSTLFTLFIFFTKILLFTIFRPNQLIILKSEISLEVKASSLETGSVEINKI